MKFKKRLLRLVPACLVCLVLIVSMAAPALAANYLPTDYPYEMTPVDNGYRADLDLTDSIFYQCYVDSVLTSSHAGPDVSYKIAEKNLDNYYWIVYPLGKNSFMIFDGLDYSSKFNFRFDFSSIFGAIDQQLTVEFTAFYDTNDNGSVERAYLPAQTAVVSHAYPSCEFSSNRDAQYSQDCVMRWGYRIRFLDIADETATNTVSVNFSSSASCSLYFTESYGSYVQNEELKHSLDQMIARQEETNDKLDGIQDTMDDANDKLDGIQDSMNDTNDKLDEMPGAIGDEMQNIIDSENDKAESDGNKFVDQVLDLLPDPATGMLEAMQMLTGAMSYTGTAAKLPLPALIVPEIPGMIPQTVLWEGGQLDFEECMQILPDNLVVVVQSLFTVAIVLFCFFELKGIIGFAFTLRSGRKEDAAVG